MLYALTLKPAQKPFVEKAFDTYIQMRLGDWEKLYDLCVEPDSATRRGSREEFRRDIIAARRYVYPDLEDDKLYEAEDYEDVPEMERFLEGVRQADTIELTTKEARRFGYAQELFCRLRLGQWMELLDLCVDLRSDRYCEIREMLTFHLMAARKHVYPDLSPQYGHSYGVGKFEDADYAWEVYEVLRNKLAWTEHPEGGITVDFSPPMSFQGHELASCEILK